MTWSTEDVIGARTILQQHGYVCEVRHRSIEAKLAGYCQAEMKLAVQLRIEPNEFDDLLKKREEVARERQDDRERHLN